MYNKSSLVEKQWNTTPDVKIARSAFKMRPRHRTTMKAEYLYPIFMEEVLPGDTHHLQMSAFIRMMTQIVPTFDNIKATAFFFYVPLRLLWRNFERFMGAQDAPGASINYLTPQICSEEGGFNVTEGSLAEHMGIPLCPSLNGYSINAFHFRAYAKIWNEWFRSQDLQMAIIEEDGDGPELFSSYSLLKRGKRHDYFTSCLPWPQKGAAVMIPLGTSAPVFGNNYAMAMSDGQSPGGLPTVGPLFSSGAGGDVHTDLGQTMATKGSAVISAGPMSGLIGLISKAQQEYYWPGHPEGSGLYADLTLASASLVNDLRYAEMLQCFYERNARGGTRYIEIVRSHFQVVSPDARLQRSEYLGGGQFTLQINTVPQTSETNTSTGHAQGDLAAYSYGGTTAIGYNKSFVEHGVILGLMHIGVDPSYQQGVRRMWTRRTRLDYAWPEFAHIGEQAVRNDEIYLDHTSLVNNSATFGYIPRYDEYRFHPDLTTGEMRSDNSLTQDCFHYAQFFTSAPLLNATFIQDNSQTQINRSLAVQTGDPFQVDMRFDLTYVRCLPISGIPSITGGGL